MIRPFAAAALLACSIASAQANVVDIPDGPSHLVATERQFFNWYDSLAPRAADPYYGYRLSLESFKFTDGKAELCLKGAFSYYDYGGTVLDTCISAGVAGSIITLVGNVPTYDIKPSPVRLFLKGKFRDQVDFYTTLDRAGDTLVLSTTWIRFKSQLSLFVPGNWPMDSVESLCRKLIAGNPELRKNTRETWMTMSENNEIDRFTWKLLPGPAPVSLLRRLTPASRHAVHAVDARGRPVPRSRNHSPRFPVAR